MLVRVVEHHAGGRVRIFTGDEPELRRDLLHAYPRLAATLGPHCKLQLLVRALDRLQAYSADMPPAGVAKAEPLFLGHPALRSQFGHAAASDPAPYLAAAAILAGSDAGTDDPAAVRAALAASGGDPALAALRLYGMEATPANRKLLRELVGWVEITTPLVKGAAIESTAVPKPQDVMAATPDGEDFARRVRASTLHPVRLGGKHSAGSMVAEGPADDPHRILLKPGAGPQNPAAGDAESGASQAKREAAYYACIRVLDAATTKVGAPPLLRHFPECHLLLLDGREYAAIKMLPLDYETMNDLRARDPNGPARFYAAYRDRVHYWSAMDFILGQVDRNAGNEMYRGADVQLIDGGSAFAGYAFDPPRDQATFVPHYLRAAAPADFDREPAEDKLRALPRVHATAAEKLRSWIDAIPEAELAAAQVAYGIDPGPATARLARLRGAAGTMPADLAVNAMWTL